jgi:hypothetical protein
LIQKLLEGDEGLGYEPHRARLHEPVPIIDRTAPAYNEERCIGSLLTDSREQGECVQNPALLALALKVWTAVASQYLIRTNSLVVSNAWR